MNTREHTCPPRSDIPCPECGPSSERQSDDCRSRLIEVVAKALADWRKRSRPGDTETMAEAVVDALRVERHTYATANNPAISLRLYRIGALEVG